MVPLGLHEPSPRVLSDLWRGDPRGEIVCLIVDGGCAANSDKLLDA